MFREPRFVSDHTGLIGPLATHRLLSSAIDEVFPIGFDADRFSSEVLREMMDWLYDHYGDHGMVKVGNPNDSYPAIWIDPDSHWVFSGMKGRLYFRETKYALEWKLRWF